MTTPRTSRPAVGRDRLAFDRSDRIGLTVLLWLIGALSVVGAVGMPLRSWVRGDAIPLPMTSPIRVADLDRTGVAYGSGTYAVDLAGVGTGQRILDLLPGILLAAIVLGIIAMLLRFMRDISVGTPFEPAQVTRLRAIAGLLLIGVPITYFARLSIDGALLSDLDLGGIDLAVSLDLPWLPMTLGLITALLAEAFKVGTRLRDDVEGLI